MSKRILIVEDEPIVGLEMSDTLTKHGYNPLPVVDSGEKVLSAVSEGKPDLILMDIKLKGYIDGIDAIQRSRMIHNVPVIYITAFQNEHFRKKAQRTEPAAYLLKPLTEEDLITNVQSVIG